MFVSREVASRGWQASYSDLSVLTADLHVDHLLRLLAESALKLTSVCMAAYAASVLTLLGSAALLHQTPLGPTAVHASLRILTGSTDHANNSTDVATQAPPTSSTAETAGGPADLMLLSGGGPAGVTPADLLTASILVATLAASSADGAADESEEGDLTFMETGRQVDDYGADLR